MSKILPFRLTPDYRERVWGGQHLKQANPPIGEAWIVYEDNVVSDGPYAGQKLSDVVAATETDLLGTYAKAQTDDRFPLLIKFLDCADWLSLQVHPNDEQAERLEGPGHFGKTEAWHIMQADPDAKLISGLKPETTNDAVADSIRNGTILDHVEYLNVKPGDSIFIRAGTVHALGPGLLLYEVQQTSDITYRVFDWNRPQTASRQLHIEKSLAVSNPEMTGLATPLPTLKDGDAKTLVACEYFTLDTVAAQSQVVQLNTNGETFHAITIIEGSAQLQGEGWQQTLNQFESLIIPASVNAYIISPNGPYRALKSSVEPVQ
jgi:mannose-6-phosphate isomerase